MRNDSDLARVESWLGMSWSPGQRTSLDRYESWLREEAEAAGGIGPSETERLFDRHIADALAFLPLIPDGASSLLDVGSGVGLPGIPIAITRPEVAVTLLDRSERRVTLAKRAVRILGLENVGVRRGDAGDVSGPYDVVTFRASLRIGPAIATFLKTTDDDGIGLFAWSRLAKPERPPEQPEGVIVTLVSEGTGVLDSPAWILKMQKTSKT